MEATLDTIIIDTINKTATIEATVQQASESTSWFDPSFFLTNAWYWIGVCILVSLALFVKKYIYWKDYNDTKKCINNFIVILVCILAMIPIVKWIALFVIFFIFMGIISETNNEIFFDNEKFFSNKILNFLFSMDFDKSIDITKDEKSKKEGLKEL